MSCSPPTYIGTEWACPYTHSVKHGGKPHSVKHGGKIAIVENRMVSTPWWKTKFLWGGSVKQNP
jgi:hypothetical protein